MALSADIIPDQVPGHADAAGPSILPSALGLERLGHPRGVSGTTPFLLNDPDLATYIAVGEVNLFLVELRDGVPAGARAYLCTLKAGQLAFGFNAQDMLVPIGVLAVGTVGTTIVEISIATLRRLSGTPEQHATLAGKIDAWVEAVSSASARALRPHPRMDAICVPGETLSAGANQRIGVTRGVGWVSAQQGLPLLLDTQDLPALGRDRPFPLCAATWVSFSEDAQVTCEATRSALEDGSVWSGLIVLHDALIEAVPLTLRLAAVDEVNRLRARAEADAQTEEAGTAALAATARSSNDDPSGAASALFSACQAVAGAAGVRLRPPPRRPSDQESLTLDAILRANHLRKRQVALDGDWWEYDVGAFLFLDPQGKPFAILRRGRSYWIKDPAAGSATRLSAQAARGLRGTGFLLYEPFPDQPLSLGDILRRAVRNGRANLLSVLGFGVVSGLLAMILPVASGYMVDTVIPDNDAFGLVEISVVLAAVAAVQFVSELAIQRSMLRFMGLSGTRLQTALLDRLLRLPVGFFRDFTTGDLMTRVLSVQTIENQLTGAMIGSMLSGLFAFVSLGLMFYYSPLLALVALGLVLALAGAVFMLGLVRLQYERDTVRLRGQLSHVLYESAGGVAKIRLAAAEARAFSRWAFTQANLAKALNNSRRIDLISETLADAASPLMQGIVFAVIVYAGLADEGFGLGSLVAFLAAFTQVMIGMIAIAESGQDIMALGPVFEYSKPILTAVPESPVAQIDPGELSGGIEINQVSFRYGADSPPVLSDFSLQIEPGEYVAVVGPSGSGKSTILRLVLGFENPASGAILFDGKDQRGLDVHAIRRQMGVVLQNERLFAGSLLDNILGGHVYLTEEDAWRAAEQAGLAEDIRAMPMGMYTVCSGGGGLSGGQVQRTMIARALVHRPRIVLFDEATSALDNQTQAIVTESLGRMRATRIVIAHRLSTVMGADRIVVVREGHVVESGAYDDLLARGGLFADLAARQLS
ncbi:NHLP bacteriocin export ABC transporter permease/ATPase subunit [Aquabacter sp. CN5-332]|uniref:NHLP bacteriocin export ABC transporter permease/ATPase subunit n=1 Tax=Aquabacter sp. CN5-332 TaxID=3156608 RepID=UPI0032B4B266